MSKISDIAILVTKGTTPTTVGGSFVQSGINFIKVESIDNNGNIILNNIQKISQNIHEKLKRSQLKENDLLITIAGALGRVYVVEKEILPANTNQAVGIIRIDQSKYSSYFLKYWLQTHWVQKTLSLANAQSIQNNLNLENLGEIEVPNLPLDNQISIASVLSTIDSKIQLNNRINAKLEQISKTLYDYWFVQFDFPNTDGKPYKSNGGKMIWNKELKRNIPDGWKCERLDDIEKVIITGKTPPTTKSEYFNGDIPFITIGDIRGNMHVIDTEIKLTKEGADYQKNKYIPKGAICVTCIASPGLIGFASQKSQTNQQINSIVCQNDENRIYLYFALKDFFKFSKGAKTGNTFANMSKEDFSSILVVVPNNEILKRYTGVVNHAVNSILNNSKENFELSSLRNWLLPMLMNGQVKITN